MNKVDYIVVGCGLAGIAFCEKLRTNNKSFLLFDDASQQSSIVAAGMYNPVILKRFSEVWLASEQLKLVKPFYSQLETLLNVKLDYELKLYRKFTSVQEQNLWFDAMDKPKLEPFLSQTIIKNSNNNIEAGFGFGEVLQAGRVDTNMLIDHYLKFLEHENVLKKERFQHEKLKIQNDEIEYNGLKADRVIFCEGFGLKKNIYFNYLPLTGTKGEVLTIKAPDLKIDYALKSSVFVIPEGNDVYSVGATYNWEDKTQSITELAREELVSKLKTLIHCEFIVINQVAGIRPTVKDRRPLVGSHTAYNNLFVLNGLGTRGVMIAPFIANALFNYIECNEPLIPEIDINRFSF